jgi:microcin C transport system substrate-binding protein
MDMKPYLLLTLALVLNQASVAEQTFPAAGWQEKAHPYAGRDAVPGGELVQYGYQPPKSFNYYLEVSTTGKLMFDLMYENLMSTDPVTADFVPALAKSWTISDDKLTFTFRLDPRARWSDGKPITASDVKWTAETILDPKNITGPHKLSLERFSKIEAVDDSTIRFTAHEVHFSNLTNAGGFHILPRHVFAGKDFNLQNFDLPVVSGPYRILEHKENRHVLLERRKDYWGADSPSVKNLYNFDRLKYRFFLEDDNAFDAFQKGEIDVTLVGMADRWIRQMQGEKYDKNWVVKQKVYNHDPQGFSGFAMNMRRPPFDDVRVRKAMALLLDRDTLLRTLMHNEYEKLNTYFPNVWGDATCPNPMLAFDSDAASKLLDEAGWKVNATTGIREKNGRTFVFRFLIASASQERYLNAFREALKKAGVELKIELKDWAAWMKDMDEFNFDMTWTNWSGTLPLFTDPEYLFHSRQGKVPGGHNTPGLSDAKVDEMIQGMSAEFDVGKRVDTMRKLDELIYAQHPYILLWKGNFTRLAWWNKFGVPPTVVGKYGDEDAVSAYFWSDEDAAADLEDAMKAGRSLPARPKEVRFDEIKP